MKINEIKRGMSSITVEGKIVDKSEPRRVSTRYGPQQEMAQTRTNASQSIRRFQPTK